MKPTEIEPVEIIITNWGDFIINLN